MSINKKILVLVVSLVVIPTILLLNISTIVLNKQIEKSAQSYLQNSSILARNLMDARLKEIQKFGELIAQEKEIKRAIKNKDYRTLEKALREYKNNFNYLDLVCVFDKERRTIKNISGKKNIDISDIEYIFDEVEKLQSSIVSEEILNLNKIFESNSREYKKYLIKIQETGEKKIFTKCQTGLTVVPILEDKEILGYLLIGDILNNDSYYPKIYSDKIKDSYLSISVGDIRITTNIRGTQKVDFIGSSIPVKMDDLIDGTVYSYGKVLVDKETHLFLDAPITNYKGEIIGVLGVGIPEEKFSVLMNVNQNTIFFVNLISLIFMLFIANRVSKHITNPILKATEFAEKISKGEKNLELGKEIIKNNDETAILLKTLKKLAEDLKRSEAKRQDYFKKLQKLNNQLEEQVEMRTKDLYKTMLALKSANEVKSRFLANMTHELRTPLSSIIASSELLKDDFFGKLNKKQHEYTDNIYTSASDLLQLINDILDISKIQVGKMTLDLEQYSMHDLFLDSILIIKSLAIKKNITIHTELTEEDFNVRVDAKRFKQILYNLFSNAVKFTPTNGNIFIKADRKNNLLKVIVKDDGIGIKKEDQKRIFNEFEQVDGSYKRDFEGTGLGLPLVKKLVEMHGGMVYLNSDIGEGTEVIFIMPVAF